MKTAAPSTLILARLVAVAAAGLLVAGCSAEGLIENALSRVEGVDDIDIDFSEEGGSFSITSEDGESFGIDVDAEGQSTINTNEGTVTTTVDGEVPSEVSDAIDLPASFQAQTVSRMEDMEDGNAILVQGTVQGSFNELLDELEAAANRRWAQVERVVMAEGQMGAVTAHDESEDQGVHANLIMEQGDAEGMLQIMVIQP